MSKRSPLTFATRRLFNHHRVFDPAVSLKARFHLNAEPNQLSSTTPSTTNTNTHFKFSLNQSNLFTCQTVLKNIHLLTFDDPIQLSRAFLRFQEFYESPVFRQRHFTLEEFKEWYIRKFGRFSYETDWIGFNIPSSVMDAFESGMMDPLSNAEKQLVQALRFQPKPYYVIGTSRRALSTPLRTSDPHLVGLAQQGLSATLAHELSHGLFHLDSNYATRVSQALDRAGDKARPLFKLLDQLGYHQEVWVDEAVAYLVSECTSHPVLASHGIQVRSPPLVSLRSFLQGYFARACRENCLPRRYPL